MKATTVTSTLRQAGGKWIEKLGALVRLRRRIGLGLAAALVAVVLVQSALGMSGSGLTVSALNPGNLARTVERQANLAYARVVRLVKDFRLVYEIYAYLAEEESRAEATPSSPVPSPDAVTTCNSTSSHSVSVQRL